MQAKLTRLRAAGMHAPVLAVCQGIRGQPESSKSSNLTNLYSRLSQWQAGEPSLAFKMCRSKRQLRRWTRRGCAPTTGRARPSARRLPRGCRRPSAGSAPAAEPVQALAPPGRAPAAARAAAAASAAGVVLHVTKIGECVTQDLPQQQIILEMHVCDWNPCNAGLREDEGQEDEEAATGNG